MNTQGSGSLLVLIVGAALATGACGTTSADATDTELTVRIRIS